MPEHNKHHGDNHGHEGSVDVIKNSPEHADSHIKMEKNIGDSHHITESSSNPEHHEPEIDGKLEKIRNQIKGGQEKDPAFGDFDDVAAGGNTIVLNRTNKQFLDHEIHRFIDSVKNDPVAVNKGYKVAASYDSQVQGWTTQSRIFNLPNGKRVFVLVNFPASRWRRMADRFMETISGDEMRKPKNDDWKEIVESRSTVPTIEGFPSNVVVMPFIESINAYDIFAHQKSIKNFGDFGWAKGLKVDGKLDLLDPMVGELKATHLEGKTWGEAILPNFVFTKDKKAVLVDPETTYENLTQAQERATDLRNLITSVCGALKRGDGFSDFGSISKKVLSSYGDFDILSSLRDLCVNGLSLRKELVFNLFGRHRVGSTNLNEFYEVTSAIVREIDGIVAEAKEQAKKAAEKAAKEKADSHIHSHGGHGAGHHH